MKIIFFIFLICFFLLMAKFDAKERKKKLANIKKETFSGIITSYKYIKKDGFFYYTEKGGIIRGFDFFSDSEKVQLNIGDSIYKVPDSLCIYIYKKDLLGKYQFNRKEMRIR